MSRHSTQPPLDAKPSAEVTRLLHAWRDGEDAALDALTPLVYQELRRIARRQMRGERAGGDPLLQTTALVHEVYLRLVDVDLGFRDRVHFYAVAARTMRRLLVDQARERRAQKRGGGAVVLPLEEAVVAGLGARGPQAADLLALDQALTALSSFDERKARVVELRLFGGLTIDEAAEVLGVSAATIERDLALGRAWLVRRLDAP